jgi:hypothetical protein
LKLIGESHLARWEGQVQPKIFDQFPKLEKAFAVSSIGHARLEYKTIEPVEGAEVDSFWMVEWSSDSNLASLFQHGQYISEYIR